MKLDIIDKVEAGLYSEERSIELMECLANDEDEYVRARVATVLVNFDSERAEKLLIDFLSDEDEMVRTEAYDSLSISNSQYTTTLLMDRLKKDKSSLVRGYSALSIGDIARKIDFDNKLLVNFIKKVLAKERNAGARICYYRTLYMLGEKEYLTSLIAKINNKNYQNRCGVVSLLDELASENLLLSHDLEKVKTALRERLEQEKSKAVISSIEDVLSRF